MTAKRQKKTDPFIAQRPKRQDVAVGNGVFTLVTATLDQEARFLAVVDDLELGKLIDPVVKLIGDGGIGIQQDFLAKLADVGPDLWQAARKVLGRQFAPAVREGAIALLDNETNHNMLVKAELATDDDAELGPDGEFLGSTATRRHVKSSLTLLQGVAIIKTAWSLNGYGDLLGNLITMEETPAA